MFRGEGPQGKGGYADRTPANAALGGKPKPTLGGELHRSAQVTRTSKPLNVRSTFSIEGSLFSDGARVQGQVTGCLERGGRFL
jgi:hypothetical protein